ncbi:hypothetical protein ACFL2V_12755 [Pseudomonadota bacterium]
MLPYEIGEFGKYGVLNGLIASPLDLVDKVTQLLYAILSLLE